MTGLGIKVKYIQNGTKSITVHFLITEKYQSIQPKKTFIQAQVLSIKN